LILLRLARDRSAPERPVGEFERFVLHQAEIPHEVRVVGDLAQGGPLMRGLAARQQPVQRRQPEPARKARVFTATTSNSLYVTVAILSDPITLSAKTFRSFSG